MLARSLMVGSAAILLALGTLHLVYTFWGPALRPRDPAVQALMSQTHLVLTRQTTMWRAWIGFNASHSMGAMLFRLVFGYLPLLPVQLLLRSPLLLIFGGVMLVGIVGLAQRYSFSVPLLSTCRALRPFRSSLV